MIIRTLRLRHGRIAISRNLTRHHPQRRQQSSLESASSSARIGTPAFSGEESVTAHQQLDALSSSRTVALNDPNHPVAQDYAFFQHQKSRTQHLGTSIAPHYKPHTLVNDPPSPKDITLELLLASQAHIGHATALWNPANARYIFGVRGRKKDGESPIHIISLEATATHLRRACNIVTGVTERGGLVLFVGTREGQARAVVKAAQLAKGCHLFTKWIPGSITNGQQILGRCAMKVVDEFDQEVEGFEDQLATKAVLKPDLVVCLNPMENYTLLHECGLNSIPTIGIIDTDANPMWVTYPIPANDDSLRTAQVIAGVLGRAGQQGQENRRRLAEAGVILSPATHGLAAPTASNPSPKKRPTRPPRPAQPPRPAPAPALTQPNLPTDLEGVPVSQHDADQALLAQAEHDLSPDDLSDLDPSLTDAAYDVLTAEDDLAQFGGVEQLLSPEGTDERGNDPGGDSMWKQVEEVERELGEQAPAPPGAEELGDPGDGAKYEPGVEGEEKGKKGGKEGKE